MADKNLDRFEKDRQKEKEKFEKEREKWQKKDSKSRTKKNKKLDVTSITIKTIAIVVVASLVLVVGGMFARTYGFPGRFMPALRVDGTTIMQPEYALFFYREFERHHAQATQLAQFAAQLQGLSVGTHFGLDPELNPFGQEMTGIEDRELYWEEFLQEQTTNNLHAMIVVYNEARRQGTELSEAALAEIEEEMEELRDHARRNVASLNAFLRMTNHPPGVTERVLRRSMERERIINAFLDDMQTTFSEQYSDEDLLEIYLEDPTQFDFVDLRVFPFPKETLRAEEDETEQELEERQQAANEEARQEAEAFLMGVTSQEDFIAAAEAQVGDENENYDGDSATLIERFRLAQLDQLYNYTQPSEDEDEEDEVIALLSDWAFDSARQAGNTTVFESNDTFFAIMIARPAYALNLLDYYTISVGLVLPEEEPEDDVDMDALLQAAIAQAYGTITGLYEQLMENGGNASAFQALVLENMTAEERTELEEAGGTPGLHERLSPNSNISSEVLSWLFAQDREIGDTAIIPIYDQQGEISGFSLALMAQVHEDEYSWMDEIRSERASESLDDFLEQLQEDNPPREFSVGVWFSMNTARRILDNSIAWRIEAAAQQAAGQQWQ